MEHHILVKWRAEAPEEKQTLNRQAAAFWAAATAISGVAAVRCKENCIQRPNRYDFMIVLTLPPEALPGYDASALHRQWKAEYAAQIAEKAIFDCESEE